jgi:uncharacterized membrane protein YphA (DoxX/SURF4 family)
VIYKIIKNEFFLLAVRLFVGFVFVFAAVTKIASPEDFSQSIYNYKLLPLLLVNFFAIVLPWIELCAGILLIFGISVKENSAILFTLLSIFVAAIGISLLRGLDIECGCFGTADGSKVGYIKILENLGLLLLTGILFKFDSEFFSLKFNSEKTKS